MAQYEKYQYFKTNNSLQHTGYLWRKNPEHVVH